MNINESSLSSCFVSPDLCQHLVNAGVSIAVKYRWRIKEKYSELFTYAFDPDGYYQAGMRNADYIHRPIMVLPAYHIKDVEKLLPTGYLLTLNDDGRYEISLNNIYQLESCTAERMPDAFAKLLLEALRRHVVDLKKINLIISSAA